MKEIIEVTVEADWNDGDYVESTWSPSEKGLEKLREFIAKYPILKENGGVADLRDSGELSGEEEDYLSDLLPGGYPDGGEIHSIESIVVRKITIQKEEKLI